MKNMLLFFCFALLFSCSDEVEPTDAKENDIIYKGISYSLSSSELSSLITKSSILYESTKSELYLFDDVSDLLSYAKLNFKEYRILEEHYNPRLAESNGRSMAWSDFSIQANLFDCGGSGQTYNINLESTGTNTGKLQLAGLPGFPSGATGFSFDIPSASGEIVVEVSSNWLFLFPQKVKVITSDSCWNPVYLVPKSGLVPLKNKFTRWISWTLHR